MLECYDGCYYSYFHNKQVREAASAMYVMRAVCYSLCVTRWVIADSISLLLSLYLSLSHQACKDDGKCTWAGDSQIPPPGEPPGVAPAKSKDITTKGARSYEEETGVGGREERERKRERE